MDHLSSLNSAQKEAVSSTEGPLLILAGAGAGKTRVITHRITEIIRNGKAAPHEILAVTFTNKAAREMRERVAKLVNKEEAKEVCLSTFHSFCMKVLRKEIHQLGFTQKFTLYDEKDMRRLIMQVAEELYEGRFIMREPGSGNYVNVKRALGEVGVDAEKLNVMPFLAGYSLFFTDISGKGSRLQALTDSDTLESVGVTSGLAAWIFS